MVDPERLNAQLRRLKELINTDPKVKARFDKDGNGVIDGQEWEEVRQLVIKRLEREEAQAKAAAGAAEAVAAGEGDEVVAQQLFAEDLKPLAVQNAAATSAAHRSILILEQQGGLGQLYEGMKRRNYLVYSAEGQVVAKIDQVESEMLQSFTQKGFSVADLHFKIQDQISGESLLLQKSEGMSEGTRIAVLNAKGGEIAHTRFTGRLLEHKARAYSTLEKNGLEIARKLLKPWTYEIKSEFGDKIGSIERGWSGLGGFLTGGNKMRIHMDEGRATPELMWALVAAALMFDLSQEPEEKGIGAGLRLGF